MQIYCLKCKEKVEVKSPKKLTNERGMDYATGKCPDCGGKVSVILGKHGESKSPGKAVKRNPSEKEYTEEDRIRREERLRRYEDEDKARAKKREIYLSDKASLKAARDLRGVIESGRLHLDLSKAFAEGFCHCFEEMRDNSERISPDRLIRDANCYEKTELYRNREQEKLRKVMSIEEKESNDWYEKFRKGGGVWKKNTVGKNKNNNS